MTAAAILALIASLPPFHAEPRPEQPDERLARLRVVSEAVSALELDATWTAAVLAVGWHESRFARYVQEGRCADGPAGARCDQGLARGTWQVHRQACPRAWAERSGSAGEVREGARCAARLLRAAKWRCAGRAPGEWWGAFSGYAGAACDWAGARKRVRTMESMVARLGGTIR